MQQTWRSASFGEGESLGCMLERAGLEAKVGSEQLARIIRSSSSLSLLEQLGTYAEVFPESRETIVEALDIYKKRHPRSRIAKRASYRASRILALTMLEALSKER